MAVKYIETQFLDGTLSGLRQMASTLCTMYTSPRDVVLDIVKEIPHRYGMYILLGKTGTGTYDDTSSHLHMRLLFTIPLIRFQHNHP